LNPKSAREFYFEALEDNKYDVALHLNIALSYSIEGDYLSCKRWAEKAREIE
jgi:hypothetical protein